MDDGIKLDEPAFQKEDGENPPMRALILAVWISSVLLLQTAPPSNVDKKNGPVDSKTRADFILVLKKERKLQLFKEGKLLKEYSVALGGDPVGPKTQQGDHK